MTRLTTAERRTLRREAVTILAGLVALVVVVAGFGFAQHLIEGVTL